MTILVRAWARQKPGSRDPGLGPASSAFLGVSTGDSIKSGASRT